MRAGAAIQDDQRVVVAPHLNTRRVAAVAQRGSTRLGEGSAGTPKPDIHPCTLPRLEGGCTEDGRDDAGPRPPSGTRIGDDDHTAAVNRSVAGSERQTTAVTDARSLASASELASMSEKRSARMDSTCGQQRIGSGSPAAL